MTWVKGDETMWSYSEPSYEELGRLAQFMPSFKEKMRVASRLLKTEFGESCDVPALQNHRNQK